MLSMVNSFSMTEPTVIQEPTTSPERSFKYIGGDPALDFVNTVDWTSRGEEYERLTGFDRLVEWAEGAGILSSRSAAALSRRTAAKPREAEAAYKTALRARQVLQRTFAAVAHGTPAEDALDDFNRLLRRALEHIRLVPATGKRMKEPKLRLGWEELETRFDAVIWPVVWSAASLIASGEVSQIRICGGVDCGWMYVDRSRNGLRRWCQMETCGTREKTRRRAKGGKN
jgi:predicted RNA-binding Zn ribbon-like protein